jgi:2-dehydro-3-deoxyphosphogluconate aldolase/(4S)-4-hydroxy-2-oxoglutarate aldolase
VHIEAFRQLLRSDGLLAIIRGRDPDASVRCVEVLAAHGVPLIEISLTGKEALRVIERAHGLGLDIRLGAGTVRSGEDARRAREAGASYLVTPAATAGAAAGAALGLPVLCGCFTPTEVVAAYNLGYLPKLFPANMFGPAYVRALRAPLPDIGVVPVGGVDAAAAGDYLKAGALAVGVGSPLIGDAADGGDLQALAARAQMFRRAVDGAKQ